MGAGGFFICGVFHLQFSEDFWVSQIVFGQK